MHKHVEAEYFNHGLFVHSVLHYIVVVKEIVVIIFQYIQNYLDCLIKLNKFLFSSVDVCVSYLKC